MTSKHCTTRRKGLSLSRVGPSQPPTSQDGGHSGEGDGRALPPGILHPRARSEGGRCCYTLPMCYDDNCQLPFHTRPSAGSHPSLLLSGPPLTNLTHTRRPSSPPRASSRPVPPHYTHPSLHAPLTPHTPSSPPRASWLPVPWASAWSSPTTACWDSGRSGRASSTSSSSSS